MTEFGRDLQKRMRVVERETDATYDDRARMRRKLSARLGSAAIAASTTGSVSAYASRATVKLGAWLTKGAKIATVLHGVPLALAIGAVASVPLVRGVARSSIGDTAATVQAMEPRAAPLSEVVPLPPAPELDREPRDIPPAAPRGPESSGDTPSPGAGPVARKPAPALSSRTTSARSAPQVSASSAPDHVDTGANATTRETPRPDGSTASLLEEYALISRMHRALGARDQGELARAIDDHGRRFASGVLAEEREAMRAMLGCMRASMPEDARSIASNFLARYPRSLHASRVEASCGDRSP